MSREFEDLVIGMQNLHKTTTYGNLYTGIYIREILYVFEKATLFGGKAGVMLPVVFQDMPDAAARLKYPFKGRPQVIKTNRDGSVNFCFSLLDQPFSEDKTEKTAQEMQSSLARLQPANIFYKSSTERNEVNTFSWFTYKAYTMDDPIYNHTFVTEIEGRMLLGVFNCPFKEMELWNRVMKDVMLTVVDETGFNKESK